MKLGRTVVSVGLLSLLVATPWTSPADAQEVPQFYVHVGAGAGVGVLSASEISAIMNDYGIGLGGSFSVLARAGLRDIVQVEYRRGTESHPFRLSGLVRGGPQPFGVLDELEMDYDFSEWTGKINPRPGGEGRFAMFLVAGRSMADFLNATGEGFDGTGTILGVETVAVTRTSSVTVGLKRHGMKFTAVSAELYGQALDAAAELSGSNWIVDVTFAFGLGM